MSCFLQYGAQYCGSWHADTRRINTGCTACCLGCNCTVQGSKACVNTTYDLW